MTPEQSAMNDKTRKEYRNLIQRYYKWLEVNYPQAYNDGTRVLSAEERNDKVKFRHTNKRDLIYLNFHLLVWYGRSHEGNQALSLANIASILPPTPYH